MEQVSNTQKAFPEQQGAKRAAGSYNWDARGEMSYGAGSGTFSRVRASLFY